MKLPQLCSAPDFDERWLEPGAVVPVIPPNLGAALREVQRLREVISEAVLLLRDASELWATSRAREERGPWDMDWDARRIAFLATVAERATTVAKTATLSEAPK